MAGNLLSWAIYTFFCCLFKVLSYSLSSSVGKHSGLFSVSGSTYFSRLLGGNKKKVGICVGTFECEADARRFFSNY